MIHDDIKLIEDLIFFTFSLFFYNFFSFSIFLYFYFRREFFIIIIGAFVFYNTCYDSTKNF